MTLQKKLKDLDICDKIVTKEHDMHKTKSWEVAGILGNSKSKTNEKTLQKSTEKVIKAFRADYKKAYKGILRDDVLDMGNEWFEEYLRKTSEYAVKEAFKATEKGCTRKMKIAETDAALQAVQKSQPEITMQDIKDHNTEAQGFNEGYECALNDIQQKQTNYLKEEK